MEFSKMKKQLQQHFNNMIKDTDHLFITNTDSDKLWELYLNSFPAGTNNIFRKRQEYDCSCCRNFIKHFGNVVTIINGKVTSLWDFDTNSDVFQPVVNALSKYVKSKDILDVYASKLKNIGTDKNYEQTDNGILTWEHFYIELPSKLVDKSSKSIPEIQGKLRDNRNVFKRSLEEISTDSIILVLELISQNLLYRGEEWKQQLKQFLTYKNQYENIKTSKGKELFAWEKSLEAGVIVGKIRNHSIGTLLTNITNGMDIETAVKKYEQIVAPENYKRSKPIYTKKMLDDAKQKIEELGYMESLARRFATLDDITINNILFNDGDTASRIGGVKNIFDEMEKDIAISSKNFEKTQEISIEDFIKDVLPTARSIEAFVENKHSKNFVSLIAPVNEDSKSMFKWDNPFGWAYTGNITDSILKQNVKSAGGAVDGVLRFSIQWNHEVFEKCDLDAHCKEPGGYEIYFSNRANYSPTGGKLDIDIITPKKGVPAVENITWASTNKMKEGRYEFIINEYSGLLKGKVAAEIEFNGEIYSFEFDSKDFDKHKNITVAIVEYKNGQFSIVNSKNSTSKVNSKEVWGIKTQQFTPVSVMMLSPNYWDEQQGIGNKHYFFMLKNCVNDESPNGFYNEFLNNELFEHRRVLEALGSKMSVESVDDQLSGLGFSSTKHDELIVKIKSDKEKMFKIKF